MVSLCLEDYRRILEKNEKQIKGSVNVNCLLSLLRAKELLTDDEFRMLQEAMPPYYTETYRNGQLFQILLRKGGGNALNLLIEALQEEREHLGHKTSAVTLSEELSTKRGPPPPVAPRPKTRANQSQGPQPFSTPQFVRKQPLLPPSQKGRSFNVTAEGKRREEKAPPVLLFRVVHVDASCMHYIHNRRE